MAITEIVVLKLKKGTTKADLSRSDHLHRKCLDTVSSAKGNLGVVWSTVEEDPETLVWLVQWQRLEDHTEVFEKSDVYPSFKDDLLSFTDIKSLIHTQLDPRPSELLSDERPVLELLLVTLNEDIDHETHETASKPFTDTWDKESRPYALGQGLDANAKNKAVLAAAWASIKEHTEALKDESLAKAARDANAMRSIDLFGHLFPPRQ